MSRYTKEEINMAISEVITTQFKKDCKNSHDIVENAGYEIYKYNGHYKVKNTKTGRYICCNEFGRLNDNRGTHINQHYDYVNFLNKSAYTYDRTCTENHFIITRSNAYKKYQRLKDIKWYIKYHNECIENAKEDLQKSLKKYESTIAYHTKELGKVQERLENLKTQYKLT